MTRKDFELIAETIRNLSVTTDPLLADAIRSTVADQFADALASTNPRFDRGRFIRACVS